MNDIPWWATPLVAGIFTLVGIGISQFIGLRQERRRRAREDERRLDVALRSATHSYLDALQRYATFVTSITVGKLLITGMPSVVGVADEFVEWSRYARAIDDARAELSLAAAAGVLVVAAEVDEPMHRFNLAAQRGPMTEALKYGHADEVYSLIPRFRNVVRVQLGLDRLPEHRSSLLDHAVD